MSATSPLPPTWCKVTGCDESFPNRYEWMKHMNEKHPEVLRSVRIDHGNRAPAHLYSRNPL